MSKKITFLSSGGGGNLKFLDLLIQKNLAPDIFLSVIADRECGALTYARNAGIENQMISVDREEQTELSDTLSEMQPDVIFTTIHRIIDKKVLDAHGDVMLNLHYSLLPSYAGVIGMAGVVEALKNRDFLLGVTLHQLTPEVDKGPPVVQSYFRNPNNLDLAMNASFRIGCWQIWSVLQGMDIHSENKISVSDDLISKLEIHHIPGVTRLPEGIDESFWIQLSST